MKLHETCGSFAYERIEHGLGHYFIQMRRRRVAGSLKATWS